MFGRRLLARLRPALSRAAAGARLEWARAAPVAGLFVKGAAVQRLASRACAGAAVAGLAWPAWTGLDRASKDAGDMLDGHFEFRRESSPGFRVAPNFVVDHGDAGRALDKLLATTTGTFALLEGPPGCGKTAALAARLVRILPDLGRSSQRRSARPSSFRALAHPRCAVSCWGQDGRAGAAIVRCGETWRPLEAAVADALRLNLEPREQETLADVLARATTAFRTRAKTPPPQATRPVIVIDNPRARLRRQADRAPMVALLRRCACWAAEFGAVVVVAIDDEVTARDVAEAITDPTVRALGDAGLSRAVYMDFPSRAAAEAFVCAGRHGDGSPLLTAQGAAALVTVVGGDLDALTVAMEATERFPTAGDRAIAALDRTGPMVTNARLTIEKHRCTIREAKTGELEVSLLDAMAQWPPVPLPLVDLANFGDPARALEVHRLADTLVKNGVARRPGPARTHLAFRDPLLRAAWLHRQGYETSWHPTAVTAPAEATPAHCEPAGPPTASRAPPPATCMTGAPPAAA